MHRHCMCSPVQLALRLDLLAGVVHPAGHGSQFGLKVFDVPPALQVPTVQSVQRMPPVPGSHATAGSRGLVYTYVAIVHSWFLECKASSSV